TVVREEKGAQRDFLHGDHALRCGHLSSSDDGDSMPKKMKPDGRRPGARGTPSGAATTARSTVSGPSRKTPRDAVSGDELVAKLEAVASLAAAVPFNPNKAGEYGRASAEPR